MVADCTLSAVDAAPFGREATAGRGTLSHKVEVLKKTSCGLKALKAIPPQTVCVSLAQDAEDTNVAALGMNLKEGAPRVSEAKALTAVAVDNQAAPG